MSAKPKYWDVVHKDDEFMGRAPKWKVTFLVEGMLFGLALIYVFTFLLGQLLHGDNWYYVLPDVILIPTVLVILGAFARYRRVKINKQIQNFYRTRSRN